MSAAQKLAHNQKKIRNFASKHKKIPMILYYRDNMFIVLQAVLCRSCTLHKFFSVPLFRRDTDEPKRV